MILTAGQVNQLKKAPLMDGVLPAFHERWSARSFASRDVGAQALRSIFEAARWAASSSNEQPWRFLVGRRNDPTWQKLNDVLTGFNRNWAQRAPVLILGLAHTRHDRNGSENRYALFDLGGATSYLTLQAAELGLTTHQIGGFDRDAVRNALAIPAEYELGTIIALGYQGEPADLGDQTLIQRETSTRTRKPLAEIVFSEWGKTAGI